MKIKYVPVVTPILNVRRVVYCNVNAVLYN